MALVEKLKICKTCTSIEVDDITGFYDAVNNLTGWNAPNLARDFEGTAILEIKYKNTVQQFDIKDTIANAVLPYFTLYEYTTDNLADGVYTITVTLVDTVNNVTYTSSKKITSECNVACCVSKLSLKAADACNCSTLDAENFSKAEQILSSLPLIAKNLGEKEYYIQLAKLEKICSTTDCGCGCS